jgi:hypothetical protein
VIDPPAAFRADGEAPVVVRVVVVAAGWDAVPAAVERDAGGGRFACPSAGAPPLPQPASARTVAAARRVRRRTVTGEDVTPAFLPGGPHRGNTTPGQHTGRSTER